MGTEASRAVGEASGGASMGDLFLGLNQVRVQGQSLLFTGSSRGGTTPVGGAIAKRPFTRRYPYAEITIEAWGEIGAIGMGASKPSYKLDEMPGWRQGSVGFHADDCKLFDGTGRGRDFCSTTIKQGDTIGCGVTFTAAAVPETVYFTLNGAVVGSTTAPKDTPVLHPHIGFHSPGEKVTFNLKAKSPMLSNGPSGFLTRRTAPPPKGDRQLQELGLRFFASLVRSFSTASAVADSAAGAGAGAGAGSATPSPLASGPALAAPLNQVADMLCRMEPMYLFDEWSPPRGPVQKRFDLKESKAQAFASGSTSDSYGADKALSSGSHWKLQNSAKSHWGVKLTESGEAVPVSSVEIQWESTQKCSPQWFQLQVSTDGDSYTTVKEVRGKAAALEHPGTQLWVDASASHIRVVMYGHSAENKQNTHAIQSFAVNTRDASKLLSSSEENLNNLRDWMAGAASSTSDDVCGAALRGLQGLALSSASLVTVLQLARVLLRQPERAVPPAATEQAERFAGHLESYLTEVHNKASLREMSEGAAAASGGGGGWGDLGYTFDPDNLPGGLSLKDDNMTVVCASGSGVITCTGAPFTRGKAAWEFKLVQDSNGGQCTCFGAAMCRPVTAQSYNSAQCWMYRSYNGYHYQNGRQVGSATAKVKVGEIVRCELDMDAGTLRYIVNGVDQGVVFTNMAGQEVYPAVAFYSSGRTITLLGVEGPRGGSGGAVMSTNLASLDPIDASVGYGEFSIGNLLGYDDIKAKVAGSTVDSAISLHPPVNEQKDDDDEDGKTYSTVKFHLDKRFESLSGKVAINGDVSQEKFRTKGSPATFTVLGDGEVLWTSEAVTDVATAVEFKVSTLAVEELELRVRVEGSNNYCHALFYACKLAHCRQWKSDGWNNEADSFVCPINGAVRGKPTPIPEVAVGDKSTAAGLAQTALAYCGALANEYLKDMKALAEGEEGVASVDLESPYSVQAASEAFLLISELLETVVTTKPAGYAETASALLQLSRCNLRRLIVSQIDPTDVGVFKSAEASDSKEAVEEGDTKEDEQAQRKESVLKPLSSLLNRILADASLPAALRAEAAEVEEAGLELLLPSASQRDSRTRGLISDRGVIELQLAWPCDATDIAGEVVKFERALLLLQLEARKHGWRSRVLGRWPALVYLVLEVPESVGVANFLEKGFGDVLQLAGIDGWSFPDGLSTPQVRVQVERLAGWSRRRRLITETGVGMLRVYSSEIASFDDVTASITDFLPPLPTLKSSSAATGTKPPVEAAGAGGGAGAGAGAGATAGAGAASATTS